MSGKKICEKLENQKKQGMDLEQLLSNAVKYIQDSNPIPKEQMQG